MPEAQFISFVFWALQAILGGAVGLLIAVLAWEIKCRLQLTREFDAYKNTVTGDYMRSDELKEALKNALQPFMSQLDMVRETHRLEREAVRAELAQIRQTNETARVAIAQFGEFVREIGTRLDITTFRGFAETAG